MVTHRPHDPVTESFAGLLLRHRGRTGLTQLDLAARLRTTRRSIQDWESGAYYPNAERLQTLILVLLEAGGLTVGREEVEAHELWAAVLSEAPRMHTPLDEVWLDGVLTKRQAPRTELPRSVNAPASEPHPAERSQDWGEAPDVIRFVGRAEELASLRDWVLEKHGRLLAMLGMGGIGKTALASRLAQDAAPRFQRVHWRSLRDAPPASEWMAGAISFLSGHHLVPPEGESACLSALLQLLRDQASLLVLDNFETVLEPGQQEGRYRDGFSGYGALLRAVGETRHQSCLVVTSREAPPELAFLDGVAVRRFQLGGLGVEESQVLLADKQLVGSDEDWSNLIARFGGNGLALKVVGESIRQIFAGDITAFLDRAGSGSTFGGIRRLLAEQIERSSAVERNVLRVLAVEREPVSLAELIADLGPRVRQAALLEAVEALRRRSLVERAGTVGTAAFTLQSVVLEYVTDRVVEEVGDEIARGQPLRLVEQPFIKAHAKDYVRQTQERLIGEPILQQVRAEHGEDRVEQRLVALLDGWRNRPDAEQGYGPGNVVNLLRLQRGDLRGLDLGRLVIRQPYLARVEAQDASLRGACLSEAVLAESFNYPNSVALSGDGTSVVAGTSAGEVWLWRVADRTPVLALPAHASPLHAVAVNADGRLLASGGLDGSVRLWEGTSGRPLATLLGHAGGIWGLALSADGSLLASGSWDGTVRLTEVSSGRALAALDGHPGGVWSVALSGDGRILASGGSDGTVRLWRAPDWQLLATLEGHTAGVRGVTLSADGQLVASGSEDTTVRLWEVASGRLLATLHGHASVVRAVALSADGGLLASSSEDATVRLWEVATGRLLATMHGHTSGVWGVGLSADGRLLASAGQDGTVRLWEAPSGRLLTTLQGYTNGVWSVALSADGRLLASGSQDETVRLWSLAAVQGVDQTMLGMTSLAAAQGGDESAPTIGGLLATLQGHTGWVMGLALSADGRLLASGGEDAAVRLWSLAALQGGEEQRLPTARLLARLEGHTSHVLGVALSPDGRLLASGSQDRTVRVWSLAAVQGGDQTMLGMASLAAVQGGEQTMQRLPSGRLLSTLQGHAGGVWCVAFSADGALLASGSEDATIRLWEAAGGRLLATLHGHKGPVYAIALSADGRLLISGSWDSTIRLWDLRSGRQLATMEGHTGSVRGLALSGDGGLLASCGWDSTVRLWDLTNLHGGGGRLLATLRGHEGIVVSVALSADGRLVASGSEDGTSRLWETAGGTCLRTLPIDRRYERLDVTGLTGVTATQRHALLSLGAVDLAAAPAASYATPTRF